MIHGNVPIKNEGVRLSVAQSRDRRGALSDLNLGSPSDVTYQISTIIQMNPVQRRQTPEQENGFNPQNIQRFFQAQQNYIKARGRRPPGEWQEPDE